ncbi:PREDICTED: uncharacterized protein LOC105504218 [Colobus angolensis palliatus]|uniref:uncharacterized protein LOC105504218 n=1 Tax=Colobus angolensis palliatus TaxID=336983 RepID=UPI0005F4C515|nr:PREDICTED: uncharacterized protein LOC105504218 [Colobus angolensis palliatus]
MYIRHTTVAGERKSGSLLIINVKRKQMSENRTQTLSPLPPNPVSRYSWCTGSYEHKQMLQRNLFLLLNCSKHVSVFLALGMFWCAHKLYRHDLGLRSVGERYSSVTAGHLWSSGARRSVRHRLSWPHPRSLPANRSAPGRAAGPENRGGEGRMLRGVASGGNLPPPPPPPPSEPGRGSRARAGEEEVAAQLGQQQVGSSAPGCCGRLIAPWPWAKLPTPSGAPHTSRFLRSGAACPACSSRGLRGASAGERHLPPGQDGSSAPARLALPALSAGAPRPLEAPRGGCSARRSR